MFNHTCSLHTCVCTGSRRRRVRLSGFPRQGISSATGGFSSTLFRSRSVPNRYYHKVRTYKEYHSVCPSSELGLSQPLSRQRVFLSPQKQGGGGTLACGWGGGGESQFRRGAYTVVLFICAYFVGIMFDLCVGLYGEHFAKYCTTHKGGVVTLLRNLVIMS